MPTIFITGASGYIGGHTVNVIAKEYPDWELVTLLRTKEQAKIVRKQWPCIRIVIGDLDDHTLLSEHGASADVVLQLASSEQAAAAEAIIAGMSRGKRGHFIQTTGICALQNTPNGYGNPSGILYHDGEDFGLTCHFNQGSVEHSITAAGVKYCISTSIVCPASVYGVGNGPIRRRSTQLPYLVEVILKRGKGFTVKEGENIMTSIHVDDVASAFVVLIKQALRQKDTSLICPSMYYFLGVSEQSLDEVTKAIVSVARARKVIHTAAIESLGPEQAAQIHPWAPMLWGTNCRGHADRLRALSWEPKGPHLFDALPEMVDFEIDFLATQDEVHAQTWQIHVECPDEDNMDIC